MARFHTILVLVVATFVWAWLTQGAGCGARHGEQPDDHPLRVVVSIPPLKGLVEDVLPEGAEVDVLVPAGQTVHGFEPTPADLAKVARADVVFLVGLGLEGRLDQTIRRDASGATVITMADVLGIRGDGQADEVGRAEGDDDEDGHGHGAVDPHLWLDPVLAERFVRAWPALVPDRIRAMLRPAGEPAARIEAVDAEYRERLAPFEGRAIVTHHASMNRLAARYGLRVAAVLRTIEALEPSAADIAKAKRAIEDQGVGAIFIEPQFSGRAAERLAAEAHVKVVVVDPLGKGDWFAMMRSNLDGLVEGLSAGRGSP